LPPREREREGDKYNFKRKTHSSFLETILKEIFLHKFVGEIIEKQ